MTSLELYHKQSRTLRRLHSAASLLILSAGVGIIPAIVTLIWWPNFWTVLLLPALILLLCSALALQTKVRTVMVGIDEERRRELAIEEAKLDRELAGGVDLDVLLQRPG